MIDINKKYKTRDGQDVSLYKVCLDDWPVLGYIGEKRFIWDFQGNFENVFVESDLDLVEVIETEAKDTSAMMIDINKEYKTRDGQDVEIVKIYTESSALSNWPVKGYIGEEEDDYRWTSEGKNETMGESNLDLIEVIETEAKDTSAMMIDINKKYKTRDGQDVSLHKICFHVSRLAGYIGEKRFIWNLEGKYDSERESDLDLVEVIETATPPKSSNPKDIIGLTKPSLSVVPMRSVYEMSKAMNDGASKYGRFNWRENSVDSDVYIDATLRHLNSWQDGENTAQDSGVHHLAHAMACLSIIIDAELGGNLIDSRSKISTGGVADYLAANTKENK